LKNGDYIPDDGLKCIYTNLKVGASAVDYSSKEKLLELMNEVVAFWKERIDDNWKPVSPDMHECRTPSTMESEYVCGLRKRPSDEEERRIIARFKGINGNVVERDRTPVGPREFCDLVNITAKFYREIYTDTYHLCVTNYCTERRRSEIHRLELFKLENIWICTETGIPHFCGDFCDKKIINKDSEYVCGLTGILLGEVGNHLYFFLFPVYLTTIFFLSSDTEQLEFE
jgi:hypothetical protein